MARKICKTDMCGQPTAKRSPYCAQHTGARHCQFPGCTKCAQGNTKFCIAHGGGRRCTYPGCTKGARDKNFCAAHGGGKRCCVEGCTKVGKASDLALTSRFLCLPPHLLTRVRVCAPTSTQSAVGGSFMCTAHGGGRRCQYQDCTRSAQSSTNFCVRHGGGRKCQVEGCQKVGKLLSTSSYNTAGSQSSDLTFCFDFSSSLRRLSATHIGGKRSYQFLCCPRWWYPL